MRKDRCVTQIYPRKAFLTEELIINLKESIKPGEESIPENEVIG